ncbi:hypothetical protein SBOR_5856 [Sclerotinia borealis F-4128]|uniref:Uncharacterized protein n=1 Tax=Sclerotinia borealis (strain F-4128) TaxID=1432307 RepID=W9CD59_SCLBF|nr:hypothetical protein SBOR_5856 [Sclerotinia borealis F-4128]
MTESYAQMNSYSQLVQALNGILGSLGNVIGGMALLWSAYTAHINSGNQAEANYALQQYRDCERRKEELERKERDLRERIAQCPA